MGRSCGTQLAGLKLLKFAAGKQSNDERQMRIRVELWSLPYSSQQSDRRHQLLSATPLSADVTLFPRTIPPGTLESPELWAGSCSFYVSTSRQGKEPETATQ